MNALQIKLTGEVTDTNFEEWKKDLLAQIASSKRDLKTDDDFAIAESDVKVIKAGEKTLKNAKQSALDQAAAIQKLFAAIDEVTEEARQARLALERQIKSRKEEIRDEIVDEGMQQIATHLEQQNDTFHAVNHDRFMDRQTLEDFTKGKRSAGSMQKAITTAVADVKEKIAQKTDAIAANQKILDSIDTKYTSIFQDPDTLLGETDDDLRATIKKRIDFYEEEQARLKAIEEEKAAEQLAEETGVKEVEATTEAELEEEPEEEAEIAGDLPTSFTISLEVFADESRANELLDELEGRYAHREIIGEIKLSR